MRGLVGVVAVLSVVGCGMAPTPTSPPRPTSAGVPVARATFAPVLTPTAGADVASGGLGLRRADWEAKKPPEALTVAYRDDRVVAIEEPADRFQRTTDLESTRRRVVQSLGPRDAAYLGTETRAGVVVDRFASPTIGPFAAAYTLLGDRVVSYRLALGE